MVFLPIDCPSCPQVWSDFGKIAATSVESSAAAWIVPVAHPDDPKLAALECTVIEGAFWNLARSDPHFQSGPLAMAERALVKNVPDFLDCVETRRMDFRVLGYIDAASQFIGVEDPVGFASSSGTLVPADIEHILSKLGGR